MPFPVGQSMQSVSMLVLEKIILSMLLFVLCWSICQFIMLFKDWSKITWSWDFSWLIDWCVHVYMMWSVIIIWVTVDKFSYCWKLINVMVHLFMIVWNVYQLLELVLVNWLVCLVCLVCLVLLVCLCQYVISSIGVF